MDQSLVFHVALSVELVKNQVETVPLALLILSYGTMCAIRVNVRAKALLSNKHQIGHANLAIVVARLAKAQLPCAQVAIVL